MKKHLSVLMLMTRSTIYKVLGIMLLMCGAEFALFNRALSRMESQSSMGLELAFSESFIRIAFFAGMLAIYLMISKTGTAKKSGCHYTLLRLSVGENWIFFWQSVYNILCFALLVMIQTAAAIGLCYYYMEVSGDNTLTHQTIFLAFYRSDFLHSLLPFDEPHSIAASIITVIILGISSAMIPMVQRHGRGHGFLLYLAWWCAIYVFQREVGNFLTNMSVYIIGAIIAGYIIYFLLTKEVPDEKR